MIGDACARFDGIGQFFPVLATDSPGSIIGKEENAHLRFRIEGKRGFTLLFRDPPFPAGQSRLRIRSPGMMR